MTDRPPPWPTFVAGLPAGRVGPWRAAGWTLSWLAWWLSRWGLVRSSVQILAAAFLVGLAALVVDVTWRAADRADRRAMVIAAAWQTIDRARGAQGNVGQLEAIAALHRLGASFAAADLSELWLDNYRFPAKALTGIRLSGAHLSSADFSGADLGPTAGLPRIGPQTRVSVGRAADLSGANLEYANFRNAILRHADLAGARMVSADLRGADLYAAYLAGADLQAVDLIGADLSFADFRGANLRIAKLRGNNLFLTSLRGANLAGADLSDAKVSQRKLDEACYQAKLDPPILPAGRTPPPARDDCPFNPATEGARSQ